jgi:dolichyl-phosphate-mannose-protein mannosyltransferase
MARQQPARQASAKGLTPEPPSAVRMPSPAKAHGRRKKHRSDYTSEGVEDNDVFLLPVSDYQIMLAVTVLSTAVRLFRLQQPSSVVFDEVQ